MKAYDVIEKYGFVQGKPGNTEIGFCLLGAVGYAAGIYEPGKKPDYRSAQFSAVAHKATNLIITALALPARTDGQSAVMTAIEWSEALGRTKEEIITLLRQLDI